MVNKTRQEQEMYVVKHNDLIRARYNLTTQQQKIILYAISKIKPDDKPGLTYEISIADLCSACGIIIDDTGYYYKSIKEDLKKLTERLWIKLPNKNEITVSWISDAEIIPSSGKVKIKFHEKLEEYLFLLSEHYTEYKLQNVLAFKTKYSIRLFEILKMQAWKLEKESFIEIEYTISELREQLAVEAYPTWAEFKRNVIDKAVREINTYSDILHIEYEIYKKGKNVDKINFIVREPKLSEQIKAHQATKENIKPVRKHTISEKRRKAQKLIERTKEIETEMRSPVFEPNLESTRELLEINKELAILLPGENGKKAKKGKEK